MVQILVKKLQMMFQTSDVSISNSNIKDPIGTLIFTVNLMFELFHVIVAVANIGNLNYS